jgi:quercetin dioxygenase-like cupin family protein
MADELPSVRRIVAAINADGKSYIAEDGPPRAVRENPARPGVRVSNLWATFDSPAPLDAVDRSTEMKGIMPPVRGTFIKTIDYPPYSEQGADAARTTPFTSHQPGQHEPGVRRIAGARHPGMHETDTIDYAIVLFGEIYALVDEGETLMKAGDVLIHRGTSHAWDNRSDKPARVLFVLVDAEPKR